MKKISRAIFRENIQCTDVVKALALLIYIKCHNGASVVANFSYKKISKLTGLSRGTIKKRLNMLGDLGLLELVGRYNQHLLFKRVRAPKSNIDISKLDTSSVKSIETGLRALVVVEIQRQKKFVKQKVIKGTSPKRGKLSKHEYREFKRAKKFCSSRGINKFVDNGISYKTLSKRMGVGLNKTSEAIKYGVKHGMFLKHKHIEVYEKAKGNAQFVIDSLGVNNLFTTSRNNIIYSYACNTYTLTVA